MSLSTSNQETESKHLKLIEDALLIFILTFAQGFLNHWWHVKFLLMTVLIVSYFTKLRVRFPIIFWSLILFLVSLDIIQYYFLAANHSFVLFFITLLVLLSHIFRKNRLEVIRINSIIMLAIIMFFGAFQKIISPEFMSGDFVSFIFLKGELFKPLQIAQIIPDVFNENLALINADRQKLPDSDLIIQLKTPFLGYETFVFYYTQWIVLMEFLIVPILFIKNQKIKNISIILFLFGLLSTRFETGFLSLLVIISLGQLPPNLVKIKWAYVGLFAICLALILARIGLR